MAISKVASTTDFLMARIVNGEYGNTIPPQEVIAKELGISRTVLREAISKLETWNVLTIRPKVGTRINPRSTWSVINTSIAVYLLAGQDQPQSMAMVDQLLVEMREKLVKIVESAYSETATI